MSTKESTGIDRPERTVYIDGVFDLFHYGHIRLLNRVRKMGTRLIVGVVTDEDALSYKRTPIIPFQYRLKLLKELCIADLVIPAQLRVTKEYIEEHGIDLVVHGNDSQQYDFFKVPIEMGMMEYIPYTEGISTTEIIRWIKDSIAPSI